MITLNNFIQEKLKIGANTKIKHYDKIKYKKPDPKSAKIMFDACMASENDYNIYKKYFDPLVQDLLKQNSIDLEEIETRYALSALTKKCLDKVNGQLLDYEYKNLLKKYILANILKSMVAFNHEQTKEEEDYMIEWDYYNGPNKLEW